MNIVAIIIILNIISAAVSIDINYSKYRLKNYGLRFIVFKKKTGPIILNTIRNFYDKCYNKSIACIGQGMCEYNALPEEDKILIETALSLCY